MSEYVSHYVETTELILNLAQPAGVEDARLEYEGFAMGSREFYLILNPYFRRKSQKMQRIRRKDLPNLESAML